MESGKGALRLLRSSELPSDWSPETDARLPVWEALHHLIRALNQEREERIGSIGKKVYSLYTRDRVANQDILADCKRIDEITEGIGRLRSQIEAVRHGGAEETLVVELTDDTPLEGPAQPGAETSVVEVDTQAGTEAPAAAPEEPAGAQDAPAAAADDSPAQDEDAEAPADEGPAPTGLR